MGSDEELIEEVKKYELIYNLKHRSYKNINKKDAVWLEISKAIRKEIKSCRKKWKNLRDTYRKMKRTCVVPSGSRGDSSRKCKYYEILSFLDDYDYYRKGLQSSFFDNVTLPDAVINITNESDMSMSFEETSSIFESEDTNDIVRPSSSCNSAKKRKNQDLSDFLKGATDVIEKLSNQNPPLVTQNSPLVAHFISLAQRIETSNIPERSKLLIEQEVSYLILQRLYEENS